MTQADAEGGATEPCTAPRRGGGRQNLLEIARSSCPHQPAPVGIIPLRVCPRGVLQTDGGVARRVGGGRAGSRSAIQVALRCATRRMVQPGPRGRRSGAGASRPRRIGGGLTPRLAALRGTVLQRRGMAASIATRDRCPPRRDPAEATVNPDAARAATSARPSPPSKNTLADPGPRMRPGGAWTEDDLD